MAHTTVKLRPGTNVIETPVLNEMGISTCNLIRFFFDPVLGGIAQKLGGWTKFFSNTLAAPVRVLWAWEDLNAVQHLGYGTQQITSLGYAELGVITNGSQKIITPTATLDDVPPLAQTVAGNSDVTITDNTVTGVTSFDAVYIQTHLSIGGLVLFGLYPTIQLSANAYNVQALDTLGNPLPAPSSSSSASVAEYTTQSGSSVVTVTLNSHGYNAGSTYPILVATTVGGVTLYGDYIVAAILGTNQFTILAPQSATASASAFINGGNAQYLYSFGVGAVPAGSGYGAGAYGSGGYGSGTAVVPASGSPISANDWTLGNWGEILLACPINGSLFQPIYAWDPLSGTALASVIANGPPLSDGFFVAMPQRQIVAWGTTVTGIQDPLLVAWCDVNNYNTWIATVTNQAGSYRIPTGSRLVGGIQVAQQGILWTDVDVWSMQYIGQPLVYSFNQIGTGCGLISRKAMASFNETVFWMSQAQFFQLVPGIGVQPLPCPVWDVVFRNLDTKNASKIRCAVNSYFAEVTWYYPTLTSAGEVAAYVKYNALLQVWDYGNLARSAWVDQSVLGAPIGADPNFLYLYQHETSTDADGAPLQASFTTGWFAISDGEWKTFVDQIWPDMWFGYFGQSQNATVELTFNFCDYPGGPIQTAGPYTVTVSTQFIIPRLRGRLVSLTVANQDIGSWWRCGGIRYRAIQDGKF